MPICCQKNVHSLKNTMLSCPYFVKKTSILSKSWFSDVIFFKFFMKNPKLSCPYLVKKKHQFSQQYTILWAKKSIGCPLFFPIFDEKITALMPILCQKNVHSLNNTLLSCSVFFPVTFLSVVVTAYQRSRVRFLLGVFWNSIYI